MTAAVVAGEDLKRAAALAALALVESGSTVGLGTGSTARYLIEELGARLAAGSLREVRGVATSLSSERLALASGVPLVELPVTGLELTIDGMDEVDEQLRAIKGLGGALTREKIVAASSRCFVLIGDAGKRVKRLAERTPIPVEVVEFGWRRTARLLEELGLEPRLRLTGEAAFESDNGNPVLDCTLPEPGDLQRLADQIKQLPGVIEHGLFLDQPQLAFIATTGGVQELRRA